MVCSFPPESGHPLTGPQTRFMRLPRPVSNRGDHCISVLNNNLSYVRNFSALRVFGLSALAAALWMPLSISSVIAETAPHQRSGNVEYVQPPERELEPANPASSSERALNAHYGIAGAQMIWLRPQDGMIRVRHLLIELGTAAEHGLPVARYPVDQFAAAAELGWRKPSDPNAARELDRLISSVFLRFSQDLIAGAVDPESLNARVHLDPIRVDPATLLRAAHQTDDIAGLFASIRSPNPRYQRLMDAVARLQEQRAAGGWGAKVDARSLAPGQSAPAVAALRRRLTAIGDLPFEAEFVLDGSSAGYDERLSAAVAQFQTRHGLEADGIAGPATIAAINTPLEARLAQAMLNLERLRWHREALSGRRIEVNLPEFQMRMFNAQGEVGHEARIIIGQRQRLLQTPQFNDHLSYMVLNPTWTVPKSIIRNEMLPQLKKDSGWLGRNNMVLLKDGKRVDPKSVDWSKETRESASAYSVVQKPGEGNALGAVKFMFPNQYSIYLHDTPSKELFNRGSRAFSHGCVRVERPFALAWALLQEQMDDPGELIEDLLATGKEKPVSLDQPMPIRMVYFTAWADDTGLLHFRDDIYGRDKALAKALNDIASAARIALREEASSL